MSLDKPIEIERQLPLRIHKNIVISFLRQYPDDLRKVAPDANCTAAEFIATLEKHPGEWIIDGRLRAPEELATFDDR